MKLLYILFAFFLSCSTEPEAEVIAPIDFEEGVISVTLQSTSVDIGGTLDISWSHYVQTDSLEFYTVGDSVQISIYKESQEVHQIEGWIKESWESTTSNYGGYSLNILDWGLGADFRIKIVDEFGNFGYSELFSISNFTTETDLAVLQDFIDANNLYPSDSPTYEPEEIGSQTWSNGRLKSLDFSHYSWDIDSLPSSIGNLSMLTSLDLESNDLRTLPDELCNIASNLQTFKLRNNRICPPYPECIDSTILISQNQYNCTDIGCNDTTSCTYDSTVTHSYLETTCKYIDDCGECESLSQQNSSCVQDCADVWGGTSYLDMCYVCDADSSNDCVRDCSGTWGGSMIDSNDDEFCDDWVNYSVTDIDGNDYTTVQIGYQLWMAENLKVTRFNDGSSISHSTGEWSYNYNTEVYDTNDGNYYYSSGVATDSRGVCPEGWHIPSDNEFKELELFLGVSETEIDNMGYRGTNQGSQLAGNLATWDSGALTMDSGFGSSGFNANQLGYRSYVDNNWPIDYFGDDYGIRDVATFYTSSVDWVYPIYRKIDADYSEIYREDNLSGMYGRSLRCLKD